MRRLRPDPVLEALRDKRDDLMISLNLLEQKRRPCAEPSETQDPELEALRAQLFAIEHQISQRKVSST
jgi:hypothetical protein